MGQTPFDSWSPHPLGESFSEANSPSAAAPSRERSDFDQDDALDLARALQRMQARENALKEELKKERQARAALERERGAQAHDWQSRAENLTRELEMERQTLRKEQLKHRALQAQTATAQERQQAERRFFESTVQQEQSKNQELSRQYHDLYGYAELTLRTQQDRIQALEAKVTKCLAANRQWKIFSESLQSTHADDARAVDRALREKSLTEQQSVSERAHWKTEREALVREADELKARIGETLKKLDARDREVARLEQDLAAVDTQAIAIAAHSAEVPFPAVQALGRVSRALGELQRSFRGFFDAAPGAEGVPSSLRFKAGRLLTEQMRFELEELARIERALCDSAAPATPRVEARS